jgi:hypothetical protein
VQPPHHHRQNAPGKTNPIGRKDTTKTGLRNSGTGLSPNFFFLWRIFCPLPMRRLFEKTGARSVFPFSLLPSLYLTLPSCIMAFGAEALTFYRLLFFPLLFFFCSGGEGRTTRRGVMTRLRLVYLLVLSNAGTSVEKGTPGKHHAVDRASKSLSPSYQPVPMPGEGLGMGDR